jgi:glycosyltransferase involved in cell wall biosynthesis
MMKDPEFSIIITTYKRPHLLPRAIKSVLGQTYKDFECIVVDDACDDSTAQIVREFNDTRIELIQHAYNKGAAASYNTGIRAAQGSLISILDDDDEYYSTFLEKMHLLFQSAPSHIGFAWAGIRRVMDSSEGEALLYEKVWPAIIQPREAAYIAATTIGNGFGLTMKKECLLTVGLYNEAFSVCEDTEHLFRLTRSFEFATIPEILVKIHHHKDGQLTCQDKDGIRLTLHEKILDENADFIEPYPELFHVHFRRLAEICYALKMNKKGRKIIFKLWKPMPWRFFLLLDFFCYEWAGVDASRIWRNSRARKLLSRARIALNQFKQY